MSRILFASLMLSAAPAALAQEEMTQLGAHVHGVGDLAIALDPASGELVIELNGPAYNIYGFERAPQSEEEERRVETVHNGLLSGDQFVFSEGTNCAWIDTEIIGGPVIEGHDHDHGHDHEGHNHDDHDHGHEHDDHGHDDHGHDHGGHDHDDHGHDHGGHDHAHGDEHGHSDMLVRWRYTCESAATFSSVDATVLFDVLPSLTSLDVQFFDGTRADADGLNRDRRRFVID